MVILDEAVADAPRLELADREASSAGVGVVGGDSASALS